VLVVPSDLTDPADVDHAATTVLDRFGGVDGLVNNAGIGRFAPIADADTKDLQYMFDLHVRGPVQLIQRCLPSLRERGGSIVNVTSVAGDLAAPNRSFYGASKAAINHLTRSLAIELAPKVRVNGVLPGPVDTPIYDRVEMTPERMRKFRAELEAMTPLGRFGRPEEVATWICHLLDDSAAWVTGTLLPIDGGRCA
jgi:NAD(P)-dependent dehydrogenase (short-subunit alcohol dehydrogenase family)